MISSEQFAVAFTEHSRPLYRLLRFRGVSVDLAEDLAQDTWLQAWRAREQWRGEHFRAWLFTIARHLRWYNSRFCQLNQIHDPSYVEPFDRIIEAQELLSLCPPRESQMLRSRYIEDQPTQGTSLERMRLFHARRVARKASRYGRH